MIKVKTGGYQVDEITYAKDGEGRLQEQSHKTMLFTITVFRKLIR